MKLPLAILLIASPLWAEPYNIDRERALGDYELNPEEMSVARSVMDIMAGDVTPSNCAMGYLLFKAGNFEYVDEVFHACAEAGIPGAMTWLAYGYKNGQGFPQDFEKMAYWDEQAALSGDAAGKYNYGVDLLLGQGVPQDIASGRAWIDQAAEDGFHDAQLLRDDQYQLPEQF